MMKLQGFDTTIISADLTPASLIGDRLQTQFFASLLDGQDQILTSVSVSTPFCHHGTSYYSRLLCRLSYRGSSTVYETGAGWFCSRGLAECKDAYISRRPSMARPRVTASMYSTSPPIGMPWAMRLARIPRGLISLAR